MSEAGAISIGVAGALGRMGRVVAGLLAERQDMTLAALFDRPDAVGETVDRRLLVDAAAASSTGLSQDEEQAVHEAAARIAIVKSGNFSLGVNLLLGLVRQAARALPAADYDIEVFEAHHRRKIDAPSGTALMLGQAAAEGRGIDLDGAAERGRDGITGPRGQGAIGFSVMRGGGIVGEHSVIFAAEDEIVTLSHSARDRSLFARGALAAAAWVKGRPPGLYDMMDVLGLGSR